MKKTNNMTTGYLSVSSDNIILYRHLSMEKTNNYDTGYLSVSSDNIIL